MTRPVTFTGKHLFVNAECLFGDVTAEILDETGAPVAGFTTADCQAMRFADSTKRELVFKGGDLARFAGKAVAFRFRLHCATLYAFWVSPTVRGESGGYVAAGGPAYPGLRDVAPKPAATSDWRPAERWVGFNLLGMFRAPTIGLEPDPRVDGHFVEWEFEALRDWGFNFARLPIDYRTLVTGDSWTNVDETAMAKVDQAIAWGRKYGVHVQVALHRIPGYCILDQTEAFPLGTSPLAQDAACELWRQMARRWKGIPNEALSFNLFNEPTRHVTGTNYLKVARLLIAAIRAEDPDRFIMADGDKCASLPVKELYAIPAVGQAFRGYTPHAITHYLSGFVKTPNEPPTWPLADGYGDRWTRRTPEETVALYEGALKAGECCMVGEFGCRNRTPHAVTLAWMEHCLKLWNAKNLGWALWNLRGHNGVLDSGRTDVDYEDYKGHKLDRKMLELLQKYAQRQ